MDFSVFINLGIGVLLSTLVGFEREQKYQKYDHQAFAGVRTLSLIGLLGGLGAFLNSFSAVLFAGITFGFLALVVTSYIVTALKTKDFGATSEVAAILVYIVGVLAMLEYHLLATVLVVAMIVILHFKEVLHKWARRLQNEEIIAGIQFVVIAFIVLPLLPNEGIGPFEFFNPYLVWLMVVFISAISLISYVLIKLLGAKKGLILTGFLSGFISSTALSLNFSGQSKKNPGVVNPYVVGAVVAASALFFRVILEVAVVNAELAHKILVPMISMGTAGFACALYFWLKRPKKTKKLNFEVKNPFNLMSALKFGVFFALILFLVSFFEDTFGDGGVYVTSAVSGILDVDAITLSLASLSKADPSKSDLAVHAITIAAMVNTVSKAGIFILFGGRKVAKKVSISFLVMLIIGGISLFFI